MWNIVLVQNNGQSRTFKYRKTGSGAYSLSDAIYQALHLTGLNTPIASVTVTVI